MHIDTATMHLIASTTHVITERLSTSWPWYVIRGAGFIAAGLVVLLVLSGIMQVTGLIYRFIEPITAWAIHKALAIALCVSIGVHIGFLLIDNYIRFSLPQLFIPLLSHYSNGTTFLGIAFGGVAVSFGILAMYGIAIVVASSLGWIDTKRRAWRLLHYISYVSAACIFLHALYAGSDLKYGLFRMAWILLGDVIIIGAISRLRRMGTLRKNRQQIDKSDGHPPAD
jgi:hypothetical protein